MFLTKEEAKQKWCPASRLVVVTKTGHSISSNSFNMCHEEDGIDFIPSGSLCIASNCMMWRWGFVQKEEPGSFLEPAINAKGERTGYCGLAK